MSDYWLGVLTVPALLLLGGLLFVAWVIIPDWLDTHFGISLDLKLARDVAGISDYTLEHDIWWERSFGPVFVGGWYRERARSRHVNRWIGLGSPDGPCLMVFHKRTLGDIS